MGDSAYSFSLTTFSRTGKLLQIEYALNAVANGRTALGIAAVDGVVIATDKKFGSALVDAGDVRKVEKITDGSGFVYAGVGPDYRVLGESSSIASRRVASRRPPSFPPSVDCFFPPRPPSPLIILYSSSDDVQFGRPVRPPRPTSASTARRSPSASS